MSSSSPFPSLSPRPRLVGRTLLVFIALASAAFAQSLVFSLLPGTRAAGTAHGNTVDLVVLNRGASEQSLTTPPTLQGELSLGGQSWPIELRAGEDHEESPRSSPSSGNAPARSGSTRDLSLAIAPGSFSIRTYTFTAPPGVTGQVVIEVEVPGQAAVRGAIDLVSAAFATPAVSVTDAASARPAAVPDTTAATKPTTNLARAQPAASALKRTFANRLAAHEAIYFIYGPHAPAAKFQFSFKYKILDFSGAAEPVMARTLQFAFTQRSLWDITGTSSPFYDTSYMPELIFESLAPKPEESDRWFTWLGYQAAYKHESNGRNGPDSRSLNTVYLRPVLAFGALDRWHLLVIPELTAYIDSLGNNANLKDYRGYGQLRLVLGRNDGPSLMASIWTGQKLEHRSLQLDFTLPVKTRWLDFETYLLAQYFNGYGESLLFYRDKSETVRAGFSLVR